VLKNTDELEKLSAALGASGEARGGGSAPETQPGGESGKQS
jgi:hypothetical protein